MTLVIAEDEIDARDTLRDLFQDEGYEVAVASNGREVLALLTSREDVGLVILDLNMPVMSGHEVLESMHADPRLASIPVVITTSDPTRAPAGLIVLRKPLHLDTLLGIVQKLYPSR